MTDRSVLAARGPMLMIVLAALAGCNISTRLAEVGAPPPMSPIDNPVTQRGYQPVTLPMPRPEPATHHPNSLWRPGARAFFKDQRASVVGDILTVNIAIEDQATINNATQRSRTTREDANLTNAFGYEASLDAVLPAAVDNENLVGFGSTSNNSGTGSVTRQEDINLIVAAMVTQVLPNGNLIIHGRQEVRVNFEVRELSITGVVRPEDISSTNTIRHTQIAEARIAYGGRGHISDVVQPRYGEQIFDILMPF